MGDGGGEEYCNEALGCTRYAVSLVQQLEEQPLQSTPWIASLRFLFHVVRLKFNSSS